MKYLKKDTRFTLTRDLIRLFFVISFFVVSLILGIEFEVEHNVIILISIVLFGTLFCGWACPFGGASYFITRIGNKLFPKLQFNLSTKIDKPLRYLRYVLLVYFLYVIIFSDGIDIADCMTFFGQNTFTMAYLLIKFIAVLLISLFIPRFFCKYLCFQKALYNIAAMTFRTTKITRNENTCISCKKCNKVCPMSIEVSKLKQVRGNECLSCFNCLDKDVCPKPKSLEFKWLGKTLNYFSFALISFVIYMIITLSVLLYGNIE
jgi:polyferredoxin